MPSSPRRTSLHVVAGLHLSEQEVNSPWPEASAVAAKPGAVLYQQADGSPRSWNIKAKVPSSNPQLWIISPGDPVLSPYDNELHRKIHNQLELDIDRVEALEGRLHTVEKERDRNAERLDKMEKGQLRDRMVRLLFLAILKGQVDAKPVMCSLHNIKPSTHRNGGVLTDLLEECLFLCPFPHKL